MKYNSDERGRGRERKHHILEVGEVVGVEGDRYLLLSFLFQSSKEQPLEISIIIDNINDISNNIRKDNIRYLTGGMKWKEEYGEASERRAFSTKIDLVAGGAD